jgi:hypothetical protein
MDGIRYSDYPNDNRNASRELVYFLTGRMRYNKAKLLNNHFRRVAQLVARTHGVREVAGSIPVSPTEHSQAVYCILIASSVYYN